jgi:predicted phage terminase large subunit-like protein
MLKPWLKERCDEVMLAPNGFIDLWAREHYKSTIITFGKTIQDILRSHGDDPIDGQEITVGLFSHTRPNSKGFLRQIKREFETNQLLKDLFPDILYQNPHKESVKWSEDDGIIVKRKTNPKEATIEAWGVVDGQPIGKHFSLLVYDDIVTAESVTTPEMIAKTTEMLVLSYALGAEGGQRRFIGTRYHFADTYREIIKRGTAKPRIHQITIDGEVTGEPVLMTRERVAEKRRDMGPYIFSCFDKDTPVLMADWSERNINKVQVGDSVVGYEFGDGKRARLVPTKVIAVNNRRADAAITHFESGRFIVSTPCHKFWSGRVERGYAPLSVTNRHGKLTSACSIYEPRAMGVDVPPYEAGYIAAMIDGEGSISGKAVHITQCRRTHPKVCERIEQALKACGLPYAIHNPPSKPDIQDYYLTGGRTHKIRLCRMLGEFGKKEKIEQLIYDAGSRNLGKGVKDRVVSMEPIGEIIVYNIQTETGNYVASGYAVKNCQMLQNPVGDETQGFDRKQIRHYDDINASKLNVYVVFDPASGKKRTSDYSAGWVIGLGSDKNIYILDGVRDRLSLTERTAKLFEWHRKYRPMREHGVRYEKYGMQADIEHIQTKQAEEGYRFDITEVGGQTPKNDRIKRLIPYFEQGRVFMPRAMLRTDYQKVTRDLIQDFIEEEFVAFPVPVHDDMLDAMARMLEPDLPLVWPEDVVATIREPGYNAYHMAGVY